MLLRRTYTVDGISYSLGARPSNLYPSIVLQSKREVTKKWLIAIDLDGTLFGADRQVSERTADTIQAIQLRGHAIVIVTGRSAHSAMPRLGSIPSGARLVCSNGAYEYNRQTQTIAWSRTISRLSVDALHGRIIDALPDASFGWETAAGLSYEQQFVAQAGGAHTLEQGGSAEPLGCSDTLKLYVRTPALARSHLQQHLLPIVGDQSEVSTSGVPFVELTAKGVDKASGLARVAAELGFLASRTMAFGDNLNDIPMLRWASKAVAMGNATSEVKAMADTKTLDNTDDGVAVLLEEWLNNGQL